MTNESFAWLALTAGFIAALGVGAIIGAIVESYIERRRQRNERLPEPNCRARVVRRWGGAGMSKHHARWQEVADHFYFGDEWRAFVETRTLEATTKAHREVYLAGLTVDDDSEFAEPIDDMYSRTLGRLNTLKRRAA